MDHTEVKTQMLSNGLPRKWILWKSGQICSLLPLAFTGLLCTPLITYKHNQALLNERCLYFSPFQCKIVVTLVLLLVCLYTSTVKKEKKKKVKKRNSDSTISKRVSTYNKPNNVE